MSLFVSVSFLYFLSLLFVLHLSLVTSPFLSFLLFQAYFRAVKRSISESDQLKFLLERNYHWCILFVTCLSFISIILQSYNSITLFYTLYSVFCYSMFQILHSVTRSFNINLRRKVIRLCPRYSVLWKESVEYKVWLSKFKSLHDRFFSGLVSKFCKMVLIKV